MVNNEKFSVLVGPDHLFEALVAVGGDGVVSGNAMCVPEHYAALWAAMENLDPEQEKALLARMKELNYRTVV